MPHIESTRRKRPEKRVSGKPAVRSAESRYTVGLARTLAGEVERYAQAADTSMSKAIATLVRIGLESQENRKRAFFEKLKANLADDDPRQQDRLLDEFRDLILGR
jgi:hypothetical protein